MRYPDEGFLQEETLKKSIYTFNDCLMKGVQSLVRNLGFTKNEPVVSIPYIPTAASWFVI